MGDGSRGNGTGLLLCTDSFSIQDNVRLINVLIIKYRLDCRIRKHGEYPRIYIRQRSIPLLRSIVLPYIHNSMLYKLQL